MHTLLFVVIGYLLANFVCALALHLHGLRQAHLRLRFLDVFLHFVLLSAVAIPVLLVTSSEAFFGRGREMQGGTYRPVAQHH